MHSKCFVLLALGVSVVASFILVKDPDDENVIIVDLDLKNQKSSSNGGAVHKSSEVLRKQSHEPSPIPTTEQALQTEKIVHPAKPLISGIEEDQLGFLHWPLIFIAVALTAIAFSTCAIAVSMWRISSHASTTVSGTILNTTYKIETDELPCEDTKKCESREYTRLS
ncbi:hypothetical protein AAVH_26467 [Aphelenchoides avenae]|nr:hypothetical protein AAVH_26467 [Aphelenchus avenae]